MWYAVASIKSLEEKRGAPLPGIPSANGIKPKSEKVDKIEKTDKLELLEKRPSPLPSIQMSSDASLETEKTQQLKCPVVLMMGVLCYLWAAKYSELDICLIFDINELNLWAK